MPSRVFEAPAPPRPAKGGAAKPAPELVEVVTSPASEHAFDVDMLLTPVANGRGSSEEPPLTNGFTAASLRLARSSTPAHDADDSDDESMADDDDMPVIHVEVRRRSRGGALDAAIRPNIPPLIQNHSRWAVPGTAVPESAWADVAILGNNVERIFIAECGDGLERVDTRTARFEVHIYETSDLDEAIQGGMEEDPDEDRTSAASVLGLPSTQIEGLWENLIYNDDVKRGLLTYMNSAMLFSERLVDPHVIACNRLALLYGPAGTGKTSLCRALAHKLAIRMSDQYMSAKLVEINSHSLFSKWFSESGKLVQKLFDCVHDYLEDESCLVVVMIDEVESIAASRSGAMSGSEPGDALRVVNAILTQLDRLKAFPNVLVLATSNLAGGIDAAFIDRADIKQYIGLPSAEAIYWILASTMRELSDRRLAPHGQHLLPWADLASAERQRHERRRDERVRLASLALRDTAKRCHELGMSGRFLRRLPMLAHSRFLPGRDAAPLTQWTDAIAKTVEAEHRANDAIGNAEGKRRRDD